MIDVPQPTGVSRRSLLKSVGATLVVAGITPAGAILGRNDAWAATAEALSPDTFATLVQMSRDIYPHEKLKDEVYAAAVSALDAAAKDDAVLKAMLETGVADLDKAADGGYRKLESAEKRVEILQSIEDSAFFQKVRGNLVTGLYNNHETWAALGYEGESASKGGYINRGFDDIDWL